MKRKSGGNAYAELVLEWAATAHTLSPPDRAAILDRELGALQNINAATNQTGTTDALERRMAAQRDLLESYSVAEDRCFEALAAQIQAANGLVARHTLDDAVELQLVVRNRYTTVKGADAVFDELSRQAEDLGNTCGTASMWCKDRENVFVFIRPYALAFEETDTKIVDTITFDETTFRVVKIHRLLLPSHSSDRSHHIHFGDIDYLGTS
jgi:hypothetical protein